MKKNFLSLALLFFACSYNAQIIYGNSFSNLGLQTYTTSYSSTKYTMVPAGFSLINDGLKNNVGSLINPNKPFNEPGLKTTGWAVVYNELESDTFLVSTSWLDTTTVPVDRWLITPAITNITSNSVLTWLAKSPDASFPDGYEVYGTSNMNASASTDFVIGDRLFALADGNTSGGGEKSTWARRSVALGTFAGQTLKFAFRNNSKDMYQLWIDDIQVLNAGNALDAAISADLPKKYIVVSTPDSIRFNITNLGATNINNVSASYQVGNSSLNTENIVFSSPLTYGQSTSLKFALPSSVSSPGHYEVKATINNVNGSQDQNALNNTATYSVTVLNASKPKTVLLEQFVSANDGESPDAQDRTLALQSSTLIVVNIHDKDSIKETNSSAIITDYKKSLSTAMVDRTYFSDIQSVTVDRPAYPSRIITRAAAVTPVSVSVINKIFNPTTNVLSFDLNADFNGEVIGDYRLNAYLTENYVTGPVTDNTVNGFNQLNNFYNVSWSTYYQKGFYVPSVNNYLLNYWEYRHHNTLVYAFDGAYGSAGIISSTGNTQNQSFQKTFTLTVPTPANGVHKLNPDNLYIVGFVTEYSSDKNHRSVLNAVKEKVTASGEAVGIPEISNKSESMMYPNPSTGIFNFNTTQFKSNYTVSVFDLLGKCMRQVEVNNSKSTEPIDLSMLPQGVYILKVNAGTQQFTEKVIIQK